MCDMVRFRKALSIPLNARDGCIQVGGLEPSHALRVVISHLFEAMMRRSPDLQSKASRL